MVVREKRADIAILRTLGAPSRGILRIFITQGALVGLAGTTLGVLLGVLIAANLDAIVAAIESVLGFKFLAPDVYFISDFPSRIKSGDVLQVSGIALLLALLSTIYPAWRAPVPSRLAPCVMSKNSDELTATEQTYFKARGGINELEDKLRKLNRSRQDAQIHVNQLKDKFSNIKFEISTVAQRLRIEFSLDVNEFIKEDAPTQKADQDITELEMKVERLKSRIDNYGEINPMAVEAYDEMKERHDTIDQQRQDIIEAKESLIETIKEIEETATIQFLDAFEKARLYFIDVFRSLFTEDDNCDLILLEPENPLESKIEIVAKPKGKRPQSISQLSGGEKTLTATALLFALYLLKPAPFCIFDEVDAPLDDANINKFNRIIKKFSKDSQFIIVTHNKLTMAAVDTIYGVHMAEQGVSAVTPVDFRDFENSGVFEAAGQSG